MNVKSSGTCSLASSFHFHFCMDLWILISLAELDILYLLQDIYSISSVSSKSINVSIIFFNEEYIYIYMNETSFHSSFPSSPSPSLPTFLLQIQSYNLGSLNKYIYIYIFKEGPWICTEEEESYKQSCEGWKWLWQDKMGLSVAVMIHWVGVL